MVKKRLINDILAKLEKERRIPLIEVHMLTSVGPSLLNRDFNNRIKTVVCGGITRVYISSQSQKRVIRVFEYKNGATRSRDLPLLVAERLAEDPYNKPEEFTDKVIAYLSKKGFETGQILAFDNNDIDRIAAVFAENVTDISMIDIAADTDEDEADTDAAKKKKKASKPDPIAKILVESASNAKLDDTTCLMGRMSTDDKLVRSIVSALHMNHSYSIDEWRGDTNSFVAVDDFKKENSELFKELASKSSFIKFLEKDNAGNEKIDTNGSAMMDENDLNSNVLYRYASICTRTLIENKLQNLDEKDLTNDSIVDQTIAESAEIARQFIIDYINLMPAAKQTESATAPDSLAVLVTAGTRVYPKTADVEFEKVIRATNSESVGEQGVRRLAHFMNTHTSGVYAVNNYDKVFWVSSLYADEAPENCTVTDIKTVCTELVDLIEGK